MKGQSNTILITVIVIVLLIAGGWYLVTQPNLMTSSTNTTTSASTTATGPYSDTSTWQTYADAAGGYTIKYPIDFTADETVATSTDWRLNANGTTGTTSFLLTIPKIFEPSTNFDDAKLTVGMSNGAQAVSDCLTPDVGGGSGANESAMTINGVSFTAFMFSDAGAGNFYDTESYRVIHNNACYAIEYTIHSSNIANFPPSANITAFDETKVKSVLDAVVGTFTFVD